MTPIEIPMTPEQDELYLALSENVHRAQGELQVFLATVFRGKGVRAVANVQRLAPGHLVGEIPEAKP